MIAAPAYVPNRRLEAIARLTVVIVVLLVVGGPFRSDLSSFGAVAADLGLHHLPYRDFPLEFPPLTVLPLLLMHLVGPVLAPLVFPLAMAACEYGALEVLRRSTPARAYEITRWWTVFAVPLGSIAYFRFDFMAVLPVCLALAAVASGRPVARWIVVGAAVKVWPIVLVVVLAGERRWRQLASVTIGTAALLAGWFVFSPAGFTEFLRIRRGDGVQIESLFGSIAHLGLPDARYVSGAWVVGGRGWSWVDPAGLAVMVVVAAVVATTAWRGHARAAIAVVGGPAAVDMTAAMAGVVTLLLLSSRLFSPQYLVWAVPFVALAAAGGARRQASGFALASAITLIVLGRYRDLVLGDVALEVAVVVRNLLLLAVAASYLRRALSVSGAATATTGTVADRPARRRHLVGAER